MTDYKSISYSHSSAANDGFDPAFVKAITSICDSLTAAGYDPYSQLTGYLLTGNDAYITRTGDARSIVKNLDRTQIQRYVNQNTKK